MKLNFLPSRSILTSLIFVLIPLYGYTQDNQVKQDTVKAQTTQSQSQTQTQKRTIAPKPLPDDLKIEDLYAYIIEKSNTYADYRVIREAWINRFKTRLNDTVRYFRDYIVDNQLITQNKTNQIDSLDNLLAETNNKLASVLKEKNSLKFFGMLMSKQLYDTVMWIIIISLLTLLGFLFILFKRSHAVTRQTKKDLDEIKTEFEDFRKKALKSKEDAVRMIYDELKKYKK